VIKDVTGFIIVITQRDAIREFKIITPPPSGSPPVKDAGVDCGPTRAGEVEPYVGG
jgi:hypothetical protein